MTDSSTSRPPQEKVCGYEYTVRRGDSFYLIAHRLGVPLRDLLEANSDVNPARLMVGDVLCIPMEEDDQPQEPPTGDAEGSLDEPASPGEGPADEGMAVCPEDDRLTVGEGETVSDIQLSHGLNRHTLELANPDANLNDLSAGQVLCVPKTNVPCDTPSTYTLRQEDTLESVSLQWNVSVGALLRANPCLAPTDFAPGVCITLPVRG